MSGIGKPSGGLAGKLMLSGALVLVSGAYAWQGTQQDAPAVAAQSVRKPAPRPARASQAELSAAPVPEEAAVARKPPPPRTREVAQAPGTEMQAVTSPPAASLRPDSAIQQPPETPDQPAVLASNAPPPPKAARYTDGDYTGAAADAVWGLVQVRITVRGGALTNIECIEYPDHRRRSIQINDWALPVLAQEVIAAQSADVDIVTQATTTSVGYRQSVATALAQARP